MHDMSLIIWKGLIKYYGWKLQDFAWRLNKYETWKLRWL